MDKETVEIGCGWILIVSFLGLVFPLWIKFLFWLFL